MFFIIFHDLIVFWFTCEFCSSFKLYLKALITVKCCCRRSRLSWVSSKSSSKSLSMGCSFIYLAAPRLIMTCLFLGPINLLMSPKSVILSAFSVRRTVESKAAVVDFVGVTPKRRPCRQTADYRRQTVQTMQTVQTEYFFSNTWLTFFSSTVTK